MPETLLLQLVSPERLLVEEQVTEVQVPARDGYIGVLPGHAPLMSELKPGGVLTYNPSGGQAKTLAVYGGFVEVLPGSVRVLADAAEFGSEIDRAKAQQRLDEAMKRLESGPAQPPAGEAADPAVALAEAMRAQAAVDASAATSRS
jgi:F-type H+-transporting ATPase subunit epsilon